jgi:hypothetical protein
MAFEEKSSPLHQGFIVVRIPEFNFGVQGRGAFRSSPPKLGNLYYSGLFRMPWFDFDEAYYNGSLPAPLVEFRMHLKECNRDFTGIEVCDNYEDAKSGLEFVNREKNVNEIIAISSKTLADIKGSAVIGKESYNWLGIDPILLGGWSLLENGLFPAPSYFNRWLGSLNSNGLLESSANIEEFVTDYQTAVTKHGAEELLSSPYGLESVEIWRVD